MRARSIVPSVRHHATGWPLRSVPVAHPAQRQAPDVGRGVEVRHERLERHRRVVLGRRDAFEQQVEQRVERGAGGQAGTIGRPVHRRLALARHAVDDREVELVDLGVEVEEQLLDLVHHLGDAGVGAVDLVDHEDHRQPGLERLAQHEAGLRERPLGGVDQQQHAVDHRQRRAPPRRRSRRGPACRRC